ncbi:hypothetical protein G7046_g9858 [Stylonectria norvegica]|nr:hypothetical protein G7046_g9858 [Stylonectria norvegica]
MEQLDVVVIGAGMYGLGAAKQYLSQHRDERLAILESASTIGGVWAEHRLFPGLKSNNLLGTYEFPDFPMDSETFGVYPGEHIPGEVIHAYQLAYAKRFGIYDLIRFNTKVISAEHRPQGGWILEACRINDAGENDSAPVQVLTKRLIVATGITSEPFMPHVQGQESYDRPLIYSKDFPRYVDTIDLMKTKRVTVFGGSKSAWDAVNWSRALLDVASACDTLEKMVGKAHTRMLTWFSPCIWSDNSGYSWIKSFWHGTAIGRAITDTYWKVLAGDVIRIMRFNKHPETKKLKPTSEAMFTGCSFSILNYDTDFLELVRNGTVKVHVADVSHLSEGTVHLDDENNTALESNAMVCATGWTHVSPLKFLPEGIDRRIGVSHAPSLHDEGQNADDDLACEKSLVEKADTEILRRFPRLKVPMKFNPNYVPLTETKAFSASSADELTPVLPHTPMMLYRFMVPGTSEFLRTKDIAFVGSTMNFSTVICAHIQGLWVSAYFDGKLARDPSSAVTSHEDANATAGDGLTLEKVQYETVLHNRFGRWRYPNDPGSKYPDFIFEAVPYFDAMMTDLGLKVHRKGGWFKEVTDPYGPGDYRDLNEEWEAKHSATSP